MEFIDEEYREMANNHEVGLKTSCLLNIHYYNYCQAILHYMCMCNTTFSQRIYTVITTGQYNIQVCNHIIYEEGRTPRVFYMQDVFVD